MTKRISYFSFITNNINNLLLLKNTFEPKENVFFPHFCDS